MARRSSARLRYKDRHAHAIEGILEQIKPSNEDPRIRIEWNCPMRTRILAVVLTFGLPASAAPADKKIDFARDVQPILQQRCAVCHGPKQHLCGAAAR